MNEVLEWEGICHRCSKTTDFHIMSMFDVALICHSCLMIERNHPEYPKATEAELLSIKDGDMNFKGIGCPQDLSGAVSDIAEEDLYTVYGGD